MDLYTKSIQFLLHIQVGSGDTLSLAASRQTAGMYYCHVSVEGFESAVSEPAELQVVETPEIEIASKVSGCVGFCVEIKL